MRHLCGRVFRDMFGKPFLWLSGPDKGMVIICDGDLNHKGQHYTSDGLYRWGP